MESSSSSPVYDVIGAGYARIRRADPRIATSIHGHLGAAPTVVNAGQGPAPTSRPTGGS